ncbi:MAG TPA: hypothetical protein VJ805_08150 [Nitrospiraceae bacterium]|nr:hypothetical protein [Nitrospiraceae bacterium]
MRAFGTVSRVVASVLILCLVSGCATGRSTRLRLHGDVSTTRCEAPKTSEHLLPVVTSQSNPDQDDGAVVELSPTAEQTAATIRVLGLVKRLPRLEREAQAEPGTIWRLLWTRQQIVDRISLASFDVSSTVAEIDCEESRADHVADGMQEVRQDRQEQGLFLALIGGALIGVVAGALSLAGQATASAANAILGGALSVGIGGAATVFLGGEHDFQHPRNHLRELRDPPAQSALFPASVWRYLNGPSRTLPGETVRAALLTYWSQDGRLGEPGSATEQRRTELLFGDGGTYQITGLRIRAEMLNHVKSEILRMGQDLNQLLYEVLAREAREKLASSAL